MQLSHAVIKHEHYYIMNARGVNAK